MNPELTPEETINKLRKIQGQNTELISYYCNPNTPISDHQTKLRQEYQHASNIKNKTTRKHIQASLKTIQHSLSKTTQIPEHGLAIFTGHYQHNNKTQTITRILIPSHPITTNIYHCNKTFLLEPLQTNQQNTNWGLIIIDRQEATIATWHATHTTIHHHQDSQVPRKHNKGGQSAQRFERATEEAAQQWYRNIADKAWQTWQDQPLEKLIIAGPGPSKHNFQNDSQLHHELTQKLHATLLDTGYTDPHQAINELQPQLNQLHHDKETQQNQEKLQAWLKELTKPNHGTSLYGDQELRHAITTNQLQELILTKPHPQLETLAKQHNTNITKITTQCQETQQITAAFNGTIGRTYY